VRTIRGISLILLGSGIYWILSAQLISSFTVLSPGLFQSSPVGQSLITAMGIISVIAGLWSIGGDLNFFCNLASKTNGYLYTIPIMLVAADIYSTLFSLSLNSQATELNPFVASAVQYGSTALVPFLASYLALSQGTGLLMITTGKKLFGDACSVRFLPFAIVCGVSAFGPFSNIIGILLGYGTLLSFALGAIGSLAMSAQVFRLLTR